MSPQVRSPAREHPWLPPTRTGHRALSPCPRRGVSGLVCPFPKSFRERLPSAHSVSGANLGCGGLRVNRLWSWSQGADGLGAREGGGRGDVWPCHMQVSAGCRGVGRAGPPGEGVLPRLQWAPAGRPHRLTVAVSAGPPALMGRSVRCSQGPERGDRWAAGCADVQSHVRSTSEF